MEPDLDKKLEALNEEIDEYLKRSEPRVARIGRLAGLSAEEIKAWLAKPRALRPTAPPPD